ncbi:Hypothetical predicted protein [Cloeon dipterum]|uniref:Uncharacterized protein n=1 Tax=Cloeon dipterum TaxID=197152 RepID=A0A8S1DTL8_9INSE|nr:Hypothetical predicted protein [Cloeon dipterum]
METEVDSKHREDKNWRNQILYRRNNYHNSSNINDNKNHYIKNKTANKNSKNNKEEHILQKTKSHNEKINNVKTKTSKTKNRNIQGIINDKNDPIDNNDDINSHYYDS